MVRQNPGRLEGKVSNFGELRCPAPFDPPAIFQRRLLGGLTSCSSGQSDYAEEKEKD